MILKKVISGGQTGADQAALKAAKICKIKTGGWAPKDWRTAEGPTIKLKTRYGLKEYNGGYKERTWANVRDSDATLRLAIDFNSPGEKCTMNAITAYGKPHFDINLYKPPRHSEVITWLEENKVAILNVAGNRQPLTGKFDIYGKALRYLKILFMKKKL